MPTVIIGNRAQGHATEDFPQLVSHSPLVKSPTAGEEPFSKMLSACRQRMGTRLRDLLKGGQKGHSSSRWPFDSEINQQMSMS